MQQTRLVKRGPHASDVEPQSSMRLGFVNLRKREQALQPQLGFVPGSAAILSLCTMPSLPRSRGVKSLQRSPRRYVMAMASPQSASSRKRKAQTVEGRFGSVQGMYICNLKSRGEIPS